MNRRVRNGIAAIAMAALVIGMSAAPAFAAAPTVGSVNPTLGPNTGSLVINFIGTGMGTVTDAVLHKAGQADIVGTSVASDSAVQAHGTFDLAGC